MIKGSDNDIRRHKIYKEAFAILQLFMIAEVGIYMSPQNHTRSLTEH